MNLKDLKVVFAGCARDCSNFLPITLDNIRYYSSLFGESHTVIVENGSVAVSYTHLRAHETS